MIALSIVLGLIIVGLLIHHIKKVRYYKESINELLVYIDEEEI